MEPRNINIKSIIIKGLILILMVVFSLLFALGSTLIYSKTVVRTDSEPSSIITIHPNELKNQASWGNELRFYYIMVNNKAIDLSKLKMTQGWSYDGTFLFFNGKGDDLVLNINYQITNVKIRFCKQCGSGSADILINDKKIQYIDLYDEEWVQADYVEDLVTKNDLMSFGLSAALFSFFLLYTVFADYWKKINEIKKITNSLGMFDYAKGIGIILVLLFHSIILFDMKQGLVVLQAGSITSLPRTLIGNGLMPAFIMISGYGFKKKSMKKCITSLSKLLLIPYLYVTVVVSVISIIKSFSTHGSLIITFRQSILPFLTDTLKIGPMWFLVALYFGSLILNLILQYKNKWVNHVAVVIVFIIGIALWNYDWIPYIFTISFTAVGYIYLGYLLKKTNWLIEINWRKKAVVSGLAFLVIILAVTYKYINHMPDIFFIFDEQIIKLLSGFILVYSSLWLNKFTDGFSNMIRVVGRYSFGIFCVHSVEFLCIPWYDLTQIFGENLFLVITITMILRSLICFFVCYLIYVFKRRRKRV